MIHTIDQALKAARQILISSNIQYTEIGLAESKPGFKHQNAKLINDVWVVSYIYMVFQEEVAFIYLDDSDELKLLYILTKHGYVTY